MTVNTENIDMPKKVGRPKIAPNKLRNQLLQIKVSEEFLAMIDDWRRAHPNLPYRTEAIRYLVETHPEMRRKQAVAGKKR